MKKTLYYVASPLGAATQEEIRRNMEKANDYMLLVDQATRSEHSAVCLHCFLPKYIDDHNKTHRDYALRAGRGLLDLCDALVVCGERISPGMKQEIRYAMLHRKKIFMLIEKGYCGTPILKPVARKSLAYAVLRKAVS